jgi:hypothetical protein
MDKLIVASFMIFHIRKKNLQDLLTLASVVNPCLCLMDPDLDPDHDIFVIDLQDANKKLIKKVFLLITF